LAGDGNAQLPSAAAAAAVPSSSSPPPRARKRQHRERHTVDPSENHTYEVGASGHVREVHGHMLGPDEDDLIQSDDSDKVRGPGGQGPAGAPPARGCRLWPCI
jgi:hypothetical protein